MRDQPSDAVGGGDLDALYEAVASWFGVGALGEALSSAESETEKTARDWLARGGKRWRPFLVACAHEALRAEADAWPAALCRTAVAVECFHKASLIHDDIEDGDAERYGQEALHVRLGVPVALNVGDFLVGEGYRLLGDLAAPDERKARMVRAAAEGHRSLCVGQGRELEALGNPAPPTPDQVLRIFSGKTAPAFEVAVRLGAALAGADETLWPMLGRYGEALGVAYQIRDDLEDSWPTGGAGQWCGRRVSIVLALAYERSVGEARRLLEAAWRSAPAPLGTAARVERILAELEVEASARRLLESYRQAAREALEPAAGRPIGRVLRKAVERMFEGTLRGRALADASARRAVQPRLGAEPAA
ncbi:MAG TPA: polyprenyl synthetase family protein [Phycisphaerae bacterium]|nr:polyprenyl synthetase family protein [Phycisphaerae bacterium]